MLKPWHAGWADIVLPLCLDDYAILRADPGFWRKALFPSEAAVSICDDKQAFRDWFEERFAPAFLPDRRLVSPLLIVKPRHGEWGKGSYIVRSEDVSAIEAARADPNMYIEDYVPGNMEFAHHLLVADRRVIFSALVTYDHGPEPYVHGKCCGPHRANIRLEEKIPAIFIDIFHELDYSGTACIDYKIDSSGQLKILEVNPRMGGSLTLMPRHYVAAYASYLLGWRAR
jgi:carbamoylphosphate synthase large subunit